MGDGFKRGRPPVVGRRVERAHRAHGGAGATHGEIAVALYEELGSCHRVAAAVQERARLGLWPAGRIAEAYCRTRLARREELVRANGRLAVFLTGWRRRDRELLALVQG